MRAPAAVAGLALLVALCGSQAAAGERKGGPGAGAAIVGGKPADLSDYPFEVALFYQGTFVCGGAVIAPTKVLTAGHCAYEVNPARMRVVANRQRLADTSAGEVIKVASVSVHPLFVRTFRHDLAVLTLSTATTAEPAELATPEEDAAATAVGSRLRIAGWGAKTPFRAGLPGFLKTTPQWIARNRGCRRAFGRFYRATTGICARGKRAPRWSRRLRRRILMGPCAGDSGSPLIADTSGGPRVVGVASLAGELCGTRPTAYARTARDLTFIHGA